MTAFIWGDDFLITLQNYRMLALTGRVGGGKTSLAVILAGWLVANGYADMIVSDIQINGDTWPPPIPLKKAAIVLDETWRLIKNTNDVLTYAAYLRKLKNFLIMPSAQDPHSKVMFFECWRVFNCYILGIPAWIYSWKVNKKTISERGMFIVWQPDHVFGMYDTEEIQKDDGGIREALSETVRLEQERFKRVQPIIHPDFDQVAKRADFPEEVRQAKKVRKVKKVSGIDKVIDKLDEVSGEMADAASATRESAEKVTNAVKKYKH